MSTERLLLAMTLLLAAGCAGEEPEPTDFPLGIRNVLLISIDTLRADHLGCYGNDVVQSPNLDALAAEGVVFERCISAAPTTLASHTSLFTGKYPHTHGIPRNGFVVHEDNRMLPEILVDLGFRTAGFAGAAPLDTEVNFHQGFEHYDANFTVTEGVREGVYMRPANVVTEAGLAWLDELPSPEDQRFFLFLHYFDVHAPYESPAPFAGMYAKNGKAAGGSFDDLTRVRGLLAQEGRAPEQAKDRVGRAREEGFQRRLQEANGPGLRQARALAAEYAAGVTWTDHNLGLLFDGLRERGILEQTLVVIVADHGETLFDHSNTFNHGVSVFDSETHVPWILRLPGGRHAGTRVGDVVSNVDVLPTLLRLMEIPAPAEVEGRDVSATLQGESLPPRPVFSEATKPFGRPKYNDHPVWANNLKFQGVRLGDHKYMFRLPDDTFRLYDLGEDPSEVENLLKGDGAFDEQLRAELDRTLRAWQESADPLKTGVTDSREQLKALQALGYTGDEEE